MLFNIQKQFVLNNRTIIKKIRNLNNNYRFITFYSQKTDLCVSYKEKKVLGYPKEYIFKLVKDVQHYKEFVPWCLKSDILSEVNKKQQNASQGSMDLELPESFNARLEVGFPPVKESYISHVTLIKPKIVKTVAIKTTFFEYINAEWKFYSYDHLTNKLVLKEEADKHYECCVVEFNVSFKFRSSLYSQFSNLFLDNIFKKMVGAFIKRANDLYGGI